MFGPHLMLDCYECNTEKLLDASFILKFLDTLPKKIGMTKIGGPYIIEYPENTQTWDKGGVSAIVIIAESHISIHTFPHPNGYMNMDIFSCKEFDYEKAVEIVSKEFEAGKTDKKIIMRGKEFPKEKMMAMQKTQEQRKEIAEKA